MNFDKTRFTRDPQKDSEGFTDHAAKCVGCRPEDMCPRSGYCERYDSPLRNPPGWNEPGMQPITWGEAYYSSRHVQLTPPHLGTVDPIRGGELT